jgi:hypothetical protein
MMPNKKDEFKLIEKTCEECGKVFETFCDWDSWHPVERPKHFYCSEECYFEAIGSEAKKRLRVKTAATNEEEDMEPNEA